MQPGRGHRRNIMSEKVREVGIAMIPNTNGLFHCVHNFGNQRTLKPQSSLAGVIYIDKNNNYVYDVGEGIPASIRAGSYRGQCNEHGLFRIDKGRFGKSTTVQWRWQKEQGQVKASSNWVVCRHGGDSLSNEAYGFSDDSSLDGQGHKLQGIWQQLLDKKWSKAQASAKALPRSAFSQQLNKELALFIASAQAVSPISEAVQRGKGLPVNAINSAKASLAENDKHIKLAPLARAHRNWVGWFNQLRIKTR